MVKASWIEPSRWKHFWTHKLFGLCGCVKALVSYLWYRLRLWRKGKTAKIFPASWQALFSSLFFSPNLPPPLWCNYVAKVVDLHSCVTLAAWEKVFNLSSIDMKLSSGVSRQPRGFQGFRFLATKEFDKECFNYRNRDVISQAPIRVRDKQNNGRPFASKLSLQLFFAGDCCSKKGTENLIYLDFSNSDLFLIFVFFEEFHPSTVKAIPQLYDFAWKNAAGVTHWKLFHASLASLRLSRKVCKKKAWRTSQRDKESLK